MQEILKKKFLEFFQFIQSTKRTIAILGGGITGLAVQEFLEKKKIQNLLLDDTPKNSNSFSARLHLKELPPFALLVKSPGISPRHKLLLECKENNIPIISEIELARNFFNGNAIGITGTDGKSTTTQLTTHLLKGKYPNTLASGNIGLPFISVCEENLEFVVLELSSYQLEDSEQLHLQASALLNISSDHLERHGNIENYVQAKMKIFDWENSRHTAILNDRQREIFNIPKNAVCKILYFGNSVNLDAFISGNQIKTQKFTYNTSKFPLRGKHNLENLAVALLLAEQFEVSPVVIQKQFESFQGLPHRFQEFLNYEGYIFINDSKSTNLHSMLAGLSGLDKEFFILILGGIPKVEPIDPLIQRLMTLNVEIFMFGEMCKVWKEEVEFKLNKKIHAFFELGSLIEYLTKNLKKYPACKIIFSPAGASFDLFKNFEERGNFFMNEVKKYLSHIQ